MMPARGEDGVHLECVQPMAHRGAQRFLIAVVAAVQMVEYAGAGPALSRDGQVSLDRIELHRIGNLSKKFSLEMREFRLDRPHQLDALRDKRAQRLKAVA